MRKFLFHNELWCIQNATRRSARDLAIGGQLGRISFGMQTQHGLLRPDPRAEHAHQRSRHSLRGPACHGHFN